MSALNLGLKILMSNFKTLRFPYKLIFAVTYKCNSKCKTCNIWKKEIGDELNLEEIKLFFRKNKFPWVNLTGGEVFLRNDIVEIVKSMSKLYLLNITTNGILTSKIIDSSKKINNIIPKYTLTVSIDGAKKIHNKIRGGNCWEKAIKTYKKAKQNDIECYIGHTISPYNIDYFHETLNSIKKEIPDFTVNDLHINFYHESELYYTNKGKIKLDEMYQKKLSDLIIYFKENKSKKGIIPRLEKKYIKLFEKYIDSGFSPLNCKALSSSCFLDPIGDIYPCTFLDEKIGNIRQTEYNLKEILNTNQKEKIRKKIKKAECPGCWTPCEAYQTILGNLFK